MNLNSNLTSNNQKQLSIQEIYDLFDSIDVIKLTSNTSVCQQKHKKSLNLRHFQVQTPLQELLNLCKNNKEFRKLQRPLLSIVMMAQDKPQQIKALRYIIKDMRAYAQRGQEYDVAQKEIADGAGVSLRTVWGMSDELQVSRAMGIRNRYRKSKDGKRLMTTSLYWLNTGFVKKEVYQFLEKILPGISDLYDNTPLMTNCVAYYVYKNNYLPYRTDVTNSRTFSFQEFRLFCSWATFSEPSWMLTRLEGFRWAESRTFSLNGAMDGQGLKRNDSFKAETERNSMEVQISPVIDGITREQIPLTLAGRVFLSQYPDSALESALEQLPDNHENPLKFVKDAAWKHILENGSRRLTDRHTKLKQQYGVKETDPLIERKQKQKAQSAITKGFVSRAERYKTASYKDLYEEFALRQLERREPITLNPFEGRMKGQGDMTRAEYDAQQEEERARILEDRNEKGRIAREEKITALRETFAFTRPTPMAINPDDRLEKLGLAAQTLEEHKSLSDNANKAYFKALSLTSESLLPTESVPYDGDEEWEEVFDV